MIPSDAVCSLGDNLEQFGKFELIEKIGQGGMAEVFRARPIDVTLAKTIAIKRINIHCKDDELFSQMFRREAEIALRFRHPGIVAVHEFGSINNIPYMSMEYLSGKTLAELILALKSNREVIDMGSKLLIIKTICDALHYIHEFSDFGDEVEIIHRDISPHNILVGFDGRTKLIDFGIAKINEMNGPTRSTVFKGKVAYMSPEQSLGEKLSHKTDIFSLGIVLWELLCGRKLFTGNSVGEIASKIQRGEISPLVDFAPEAPTELRTVCRIALSVDPEARYKSAREMGLELEAIQKKYFAQVDHRYVAKCLRELFPEDFETAQKKVKEQTTVAAVLNAVGGDTTTLVLPLKPSTDLRSASRLGPGQKLPPPAVALSIPMRERGTNQLVLAARDNIALELELQPISQVSFRYQRPPHVAEDYPSWVTSIAVFFVVISICLIGRSLTIKKRGPVNQTEFASRIESQPRR